MLGWSASIARLTPEMYDRILSLAYETGAVVVTSPRANFHEISDDWSIVRKRHSLEGFRRTVLERQGYTCVVCGTQVREVMEVAHISPYSSDKTNRANPANGIALCAFCHKAYDRHVLRIAPDAHVEVHGDMAKDPVAQLHVSGLDQTARTRLLRGVDLKLLEHRYHLAGIKI